MNSNNTAFSAEQQTRAQALDRVTQALAGTTGFARKGFNAKYKPIGALIYAADWIIAGTSSELDEIEIVSTHETTEILIPGIVPDEDDNAESYDCEGCGKSHKYEDLAAGTHKHAVKELHNLAENLESLGYASTAQRLVEIAESAQFKDRIVAETRKAVKELDKAVETVTDQLVEALADVLDEEQPK